MACRNVGFMGAFSKFIEVSFFTKFSAGQHQAGDAGRGYHQLIVIGEFTEIVKLADKQTHRPRFLLAGARAAYQVKFFPQVEAAVHGRSSRWKPS